MGSMTSMTRQINLIVVHCSATADGDSLFSGKAGQPGFLNAADRIDAMHAARGFQRTHPDAKFWNPHLQHIGYHFVIACNGAVFTGRGLDEIGAHSKGFNANSVGICMTGTARFSAAQFEKLAFLIRQLSGKYGLPLTAAKRIVDKAAPLGYRQLGGTCGHRDLSPDLNGNGLIEPFEYLKTCPGFDVAAYLKRGLTPLAENLCDEIAH